MDLASAPAAVVSAYLEMLVFDICCGRNGRAGSRAGRSKRGSPIYRPDVPGRPSHNYPVTMPMV
jgi:hypothetical protein